MCGTGRRWPSLHCAPAVQMTQVTAVAAGLYLTYTLNTDKHCYRVREAAQYIGLAGMLNQFARKRNWRLCPNRAR